MEHAADALKMSFAIFVFVIAITIIFIMVSKVKYTADFVLYYNDKTNFYEHTTTDNGNNRTVKVADIVATLYRYYKESVAVTVVIDGDTYFFDLGNENYITVQENGRPLIKLGTEENIEKNLGQFVYNLLIKDNSNAKAKFSEDFTEIPTSGIYSTGADGSEITLSAGGKKVYITYTKL